MALDFTMIAVLRKQPTYGAAAAGKFYLNFLKQKVIQVNDVEMYYFIFVELTYINKQLESIKINVLSKDASLLQEKVTDFKDLDIDALTKKIENRLEKYNDIMNLYANTVEGCKSFIDQCIDKGITAIPFKTRTQALVFEQTQQKAKNKVEQDFSTIDIKGFRDYLAEIIARGERKRPDKVKNIKIDMLELSHKTDSCELDVVNDKTFKEDFLTAYETLLLEYSDYTFKIRAPGMTTDRNTIFYSKFLKEHLIMIMFIEKANNGSYVLQLYLHCLKCVSLKLPYTQCKYTITDKSIWVRKTCAQIKKLMQKYFLSNLAMKLGQNFAFYGNDLEKLENLCEQMNFDIDVTSFCKKLRNFFGNQGKLPQNFVDMNNRIFRRVIRLFLKKINHPDAWYFIYKHPDGDSGMIDQQFAIRDKSIMQMVKRSLNSSYEVNMNSFLMMRLAYAATNRVRFSCSDKFFIQHILSQAFDDSSKSVKKCNSKLLMMNYMPVGSKEMVTRNGYNVEDGCSNLNKVLEFEESSFETFRKIKEQVTKTNILNIIRSFFNYLSLEVQMMNTAQEEDMISEMLRVDLNFFNNEERYSLYVIDKIPDINVLSQARAVLLRKGYFKPINVGSTRDRPSFISLCKVITYKELDSDSEKLQPFMMQRLHLSRNSMPIADSQVDDETEEEESFNESLENNDMEFDEKKHKIGNEFIDYNFKPSPDMMAIIMELDFVVNQPQYILRYYFTMATTPEQAEKALSSAAREVKECVSIANKNAIIQHVEKLKSIPEFIELQDYTKMDERQQLEEPDSAVNLNKPSRRKESDIYSANWSEAAYGFGGGKLEKKEAHSDIFNFNITGKVVIDCPELTTGNTSDKSSIIGTLPYELRKELGATLEFFSRQNNYTNKAIDEFMFVLNRNMLVRINNVTLKEKVEDQSKISFNEGPGTGSIMESKTTYATPGPNKGQKEKIVKKQVIVTYYAAEEIPGDFLLVSNIVKNHIEKCVLEGYCKFIRRMSSMRADSVLARYFLSEESREFKFHYPKVNDKANFLFLLKNNLHQIMSRVTGTLETGNTREEYSMVKNFGKSSIVKQPGDDYSLSISQRNQSKQQDSTHDSESSQTGKLSWLSPPSEYLISTSKVDNMFFFNYNETNAATFGPVLFFLTVIESVFEINLYPEFIGSDGLVTNLVKPADDGLSFDTLKFEDGLLSPNIEAVNDVKLIKCSREPPVSKNATSILFTINSRGAMKDSGLTDVLEQAIKNAYIELLIEQWLHSLYIRPSPHFKVATQETEIISYFQMMLNLQVAPPSVNRRSLTHKIQSINYFRHFITAVLKTCTKEFTANLKNKDCTESIHAFEDCNGHLENFSTIEDMHEYIEKSYKFDIHNDSLDEDNESAWDDPPTDREHKRSQQVIKEDLPTASGSNSARLPYENFKKNTRDTPKKFNHYSFDIKNAKLEKVDSFLVILRLKPPAAGSDSTAQAENYIKVNSNQSEPKNGTNYEADERKFFFPIRRYMICFEVNFKQVSIVSYNVKEDILVKLFERIAEEITFQEIREIALLGLSSLRFLNAISSQTHNNDFDNRLCDRVEKTKVSKKITDVEMNLKLSVGVRFSDKDTARVKQNTGLPTATMTEKILEVIKKPSNFDLPEHLQIKFSDRSLVKHLMTKILATIRAMHDKIHNESLKVKLLPSPRPLRNDWIRDNNDDDSSLASEEEEFIEGKKTPHQNLRSFNNLLIPRKSVHDDNSSVISGSMMSESIFNANTLSAQNSPTFKKSSFIKDKYFKGLTNLALINVSEGCSPAIMREGEFDFATPTSPHHASPEIPQLNLQLLPLDHTKSLEEKQYWAIEVPVEKMQEYSLMNLKSLQANLMEHVYDMNVRRIFDLDDTLVNQHFDTLKDRCTLST